MSFGCGLFRKDIIQNIFVFSLDTEESDLIPYSMLKIQISSFGAGYGTELILETVPIHFRHRLVLKLKLLSRHRL